MKRNNYILFTVLFLIYNTLAFSQTFEYLSPKNNSILVSLSNDIILKSNEDIDRTSLTQSEFKVVGSISGNHTGVVKLSDDNKTILFLPNNKFAPDETVTVLVKPGIKTVSGSEFSNVSFQFKTTPLLHSIKINPLSLKTDENYSKYNNKTLYKSLSTNDTDSLLPADFPKLTLGISNNPAQGEIFLANNNANYVVSDSSSNFLMIVNNKDSVLKYKRISLPAFDFKVQPNGELSYADLISLTNRIYFSTRWIVMDTTLTPIDTFQCGNGYTADPHDFLLLPNGHALLFATDPEPYDMRPYGGDSNAVVTGAVIQELDASKNVVFQWRTWDHLPMTDSYIDLKQKTVDLIHGNALDVDSVGNILFSMRYLSSIIEINRQTGNIDWMLGGKQNQFTFINENEANAPNYFSYQHDVRILPNGDITLFDNGNQHSPQYSRAVEYQLDVKNKTATMVWEYRHNPDIYAAAMGSVQRLSNGNTLIGWGEAPLFSGKVPAFTEIHPDKSIALEMYLPKGQSSYRIYKFPFGSQPKVTASITELSQGNTYKFNRPDTTGISIKFTQISSSLNATANVSIYNYAPLNPTFKGTAPIILPRYFNLQLLRVSSYIGEVHINLKYFPQITTPQETIVYGRSSEDSSFKPFSTRYDSTKNELVFTTTMTGDFTFGYSVATNVSDLNNTVKIYKLYQNYPNPFNPSTEIEYTIPEESHVSIDIYNTLGQRVTTLVNGERRSGSYEIKWDASNLSSGVYFYSIKATGNTGRNFFSVKKMILLK